LALFGAGPGSRSHLFEGLGFYTAASVIAGVPAVMIDGEFAADFPLAR